MRSQAGIHPELMRLPTVTPSMSEPSTDDSTCIFCALIGGVDHPDLMSRSEHIVHRDGFVTAFVSSHQWPGRVPNVIVAPNAHYRDVFELPVELAPHIHRGVRLVAESLTSMFAADGITVRQNNRLAGGQDVFHHHTHVLPRYNRDPGYPALGEKTLWDPEELDVFAERLRHAAPAAGAQAFHRTLPRKRIGAGAIFTDTSERVLIVKPTYKDTWEIPGGAVEDDESPWEGCRREVAEELGIEIDTSRLLCVDYNRSKPDYLESLMFVFDGGVLDESQVAAIELDTNELAEWRWAEKREALDLLGDRVAGRLRTVWSADDRISAVYLEGHERID